MGNIQSPAPRMRDPPMLQKRVVIISDTHGAHREIARIPECDFLIHAGDFTRFGSREDAADFNEWLGEQTQAGHRIVVEGNHEDNAPWRDEAREVLSNAVFLRNEGAVLDSVRIFGKGFFWNMRSRNPHNDLCESGVDILVQHNPASGYVDGGRGCPETVNLLKRVQPRLFACGHVHTARGLVRRGEAPDGELQNTLVVNGAMVTGGHEGTGDRTASYVLSGEPVVVDI